MHSHAPTDKSAVEENAQVCLALHRCWLGAAYSRGADSHEEGSLMLLAQHMPAAQLRNGFDGHLDSAKHLGAVEPLGGKQTLHESDVLAQHTPTQQTPTRRGASEA